MGDLHGNHRALVHLLNKVNFNYAQDDLIFLGDLADGYPDPHLCLETLLRIKNLIPIWGNHDLWLKSWLDSKISPQFKKIPSWSHTVSCFEPMREELAAYFSKCKYYHMEGHSFFTHGGFNHKRVITKQKLTGFCLNRRLYEVAQQYEKQRIRIKPIFDEQNSINIKEIFIGHTPTLSHKPHFVSNLINLDTGASNGGVLTLMEIESKRHWQSPNGKKLYNLKQQT